MSIRGEAIPAKFIDLRISKTKTITSTVTAITTTTAITALAAVRDCCINRNVPTSRSLVEFQ